MSEFKAIGPYAHIWSADEQDAQQGLESIKHELSIKYNAGTVNIIPAERTFALPMSEVARRVGKRIGGALKRLAENDGAPATWCPHCAEAEANPLPPPGSEGDE